MGDIQLEHSAKGTTWTKKGAAYVNKIRKNGKWVYTYASNKAGQAAQRVNTAAAQASNTVRSAIASSKYNPDVISTRTRKKARKTIAKGKATVDNIITQLRRAKNTTRAKIVNKKLNADYKKKYKTNREADAKKAGQRIEVAYKKAQKERMRKQAINNAANPYSRSKTLAAAKKAEAQRKAKNKVSNATKTAKTAATVARAKATNAVVNKKYKKKNKSVTTHYRRNK